MIDYAEVRICFIDLGDGRKIHPNQIKDAKRTETTRWEDDGPKGTTQVEITTVDGNTITIEDDRDKVWKQL